MKIAPLKISDPWYGRILNDDQVAIESLHGVPIESTVQMELVELLHSGPEDNYRPYLHMRGELTEATPAVELPYGVTELAMRRCECRCVLRLQPSSVGRARGEGLLH